MSDRSPNDQRSDAMNPNNDEYYRSRGIERDDGYDDAGGIPDGGFPDGDGGSW